MSSQTEQALALLFRRFRESEVAENELVKVMSLTLNWTKPSRAKHLLDRGVNAGLLERDDETYAARFDPTAVDVPFGFSPDASLFEPVDVVDEDETSAPEADATDAVAEEDPTASAAEAEARSQAPEDEAEAGSPLDRLLDRIAAGLEGGRNRAVARVNAKQEALGGLVTLDAAALLVAKEHGLDVAEDAREVLERLQAA